MTLLIKGVVAVSTDGRGTLSTKEKRENWWRRFLKKLAKTDIRSPGTGCNA